MVAAARALLSFIVGGALGLGVVAAGAWAFQYFFPTPAAEHAANPRALGPYLATAPLESLIGLPLIWTLAAAIASFAAAKISGRSAGWIAGAAFFVGTLLNLVFIPHPWWMLIVVAVALTVATDAATRAGAK